MERLTSRQWVLGWQESKLDPTLLQAFVETVYRAGELNLRIGEPNEALRVAQANHGVASSAYVTAWNPYSRKVEPADNDQAHAELASVVRSRGWQAVKGIGEHPSNEWPGEESLLVFGPSREEAMALGERFDQNAIVWADEHGVPWLVVLR